MKKYSKPYTEYVTLTPSIRLLGLGDPSTPGSNQSETPDPNEWQAPQRRVF